MRASPSQTDLGGHDPGARATFMLAEGVDLRVVIRVLGRSQIAVTTDTHAHVLTKATPLATEKAMRYSPARIGCRRSSAVSLAVK